MFENNELIEFFITKVADPSFNYQNVSKEWLNVFKTLFTFVNKKGNKIRFSPKPFYRPNYTPIGTDYSK